MKVKTWLYRCGCAGEEAEMYASRKNLRLICPDCEQVTVRVPRRWKLFDKEDEGDATKTT